MTVDYDRIAKIAKDASDVSFNRMEKSIKKCVREEFDNVGMGDRDKVRRIMIFGEQCMENKQNMRRGLFTSIGGHMATAVLTLGAMWIAVKSGLGG